MGVRFERIVVHSERGRETLAAFDRHGIRYTYKETEGGHTWPNWRAYLAEFAPMPNASVRMVTRA